MGTIMCLLISSLPGMVDWLQSLKTIFINVSHRILVASLTLMALFKDKDYCPIEIIKGLTDMGQFQYLTKLKGPQEGTYLYGTQFHSLR